MVNKVEHGDEDLQEFKSSFNVNAEVPDPVGDKTDEKPRGPGEPMKKIDTKSGMMNAVVKKMATMKKEDLSKLYGQMFAEGDDMDDDDDDEDEKDQKVEGRKLKKEDVNVTEDINALFNGIDLEEEYKVRIRTVFESALIANVNEQLEKIAVESEADLAEATETLLDTLTEKVDNYLDYIVSEWVESNKLAIETGVKSEMVENFMQGLKTLFTEHYVDLPESKVDVVEELVAKVEDLETRLNEETDRNVELLGLVKDFEKETVFNEATSDLTSTQIEKLRVLAEGIEYTSSDIFESKISMLKEQYFDTAEVSTRSVQINDDFKNPTSLEEEVQVKVDPSMAPYVHALSRSVKK